ncbi:MAG: hypothetical protein KAS32_12075 [Candidatus Peribacteraceae bacterium]|nr:hypothetical protein [Candidatus Peribacteraceae bacterium]
MFPQELIDDCYDGLREEGRKFFSEWIKEYGKEWDAACGSVEIAEDYSIPHPIHLREGMQIRNFMRESGYCDDYDSHAFDNKWGSLIEEVLKKDL